MISIRCKRPYEKEDLLGGVVDLSFGGGYAKLSRLLILHVPFCVCQLLSKASDVAGNGFPTQ